MRRWIFLGLLLALCVLFPHAALQVAVTAAGFLAGKTAVWAFAAGLLARPRIARRIRGAR